MRKYEDTAPLELVVGATSSAWGLRLATAGRHSAPPRRPAGSEVRPQESSLSRGHVIANPFKGAREQLYTKFTRNNTIRVICRGLKGKR